MNFHKVELAISAAHKSQFIKSGLPEIVFAGRSNVGKSSLINKVLNRKNFARTSSTPGKTATINYYLLDGKVYLVDLPGYGFAKVSKEKKRTWGVFIEDYFRLSKNIELVFSLVDIRHDPTNDDIAMAEFLKAAEIPFMVVATKADKLSKTAASESVANIREKLALSEDTEVISFSAKTGQGCKEIVDIINEFDNITEVKDALPKSNDQG
ncbi:MAG: YihA family ribosome biogenesis GTP-binding protein [Clostridia bacterium]|nr:YihA family ribosome biogenesis GTP-binding protein [Clostridia bacterium]